MKLAVLNYETGDINLVSNIPEDISNFETFVYDILEYKSSEVAGMLLEDDFQVIRYTYDPVLKKKVYDNENLLNNG